VLRFKLIFETGAYGVGDSKPDMVHGLTKPAEGYSQDVFLIAA